MNCNYFFTDETGNKLATVMVKEIRRFALEWTKTYTIYVILNGTVNFFSEGANFEISAGEAVIINPYTPYSTLSDKKGRLALTLHLSQSLFERYSDKLHMPMFLMRLGEESEDISHICAITARLMLIGINNDTISRARFEGYLHLIVALMLEKFVHKDMPNMKFSEKINGLFTYEKMMLYIDNNYYSDISLEDVAKIGNYNPNYVSQLFKFKVGMNFHEYITRIRLLNAIADLNGTDKSMTEISLDNGFTSGKTFSRNFKKMYGMTPSEYKARIMGGEFRGIKYVQNRKGAQLRRLLTNTATQVTPELLEILKKVANSYDFLIK